MVVAGLCIDYGLCLYVFLCMYVCFCVIEKSHSRLTGIFAIRRPAPLWIEIAACSGCRRPRRIVDSAGLVILGGSKGVLYQVRLAVATLAWDEMMMPRYSQSGKVLPRTKAGVMIMTILRSSAPLNCNGEKAQRGPSQLQCESSS